jgi:hypothetical protein
MPWMVLMRRSFLPTHLDKTERDSETEKDRERDRERQREMESERHTKTERERERVWPAAWEMIDFLQAIQSG